MKDLAQALLSEEIRSLCREGASGALSVSAPDGVHKTLFFRAGRIVFAYSSVEKDKLGEHLIRLGRISRNEFALAYQTSLDRHERIGQTLVEAGLLEAEEIGRLVAMQVQKIALSLFTWTAGQMQFDEATNPIHDDICVDLAASRLLFEGCRIFPDVDRFEVALGDPERRLRVSAYPPFDISRIALTPAEKAVIGDAVAEARISDILAGSFPRPLLVRGIYALLMGGIIEELQAEPPLPIYQVEQDTVSFRMALAPPAASAEPGRQDVRERLLQLYEALPRATHYEVLGVPLGASLEAIEETYQRLSAEHEREWAELQEDVRLGSIITTVKLRQREAYLVLSTPLRRAEYDRQLAESRAIKTATPTLTLAEDNQNDAQMLFREAKGLIERGDREPAVALLLQAVTLTPKDRACRRLLAITLAQHPTLARNAERHFLAALDLDSSDAELRFRLAMYYKRLGLAARAIVQLKMVLGADPTHDGARRELNALEMLGKQR